MAEVRIKLPDDATFETVAQFPAHIRGGLIDSTSGDLKISLGVPFSSKYDGLPVTDRPGEMLYFVAFARVPEQHYGTASDDADDGEPNDDATEDSYTDLYK